jgi:hypothetical protein
MKTGFVTDQIFPRSETEDLLHELIGNFKIHVDSSCRSEFDFLALKRATGNDARAIVHFYISTERPK